MHESSSAVVESHLAMALGGKPTAVCSWQDMADAAGRQVTADLAQQLLRDPSRSAQAY